MELINTTPKRVSISSKRQITIPKKYYSNLGFDKEAICTVDDGKLILIPAESVSGGEFAEQILSDLINEGYTGQNLLKQFKKRQSEVRPAVERLIHAAKDAAQGRAEYDTYEDVFGTENIQ